jgi:hypothetical protein
VRRLHADAGVERARALVGQLARGTGAARRETARVTQRTSVQGLGVGVCGSLQDQGALRALRTMWRAMESSESPSGRGASPLLRTAA